MPCFEDVIDYTPVIDEGNGSDYQPIKAKGLIVQLQDVKCTTGDKSWNEGHVIVEFSKRVAEGEYEGRYLGFPTRFDLDEVTGEIKSMKDGSTYEVRKGGMQKLADLLATLDIPNELTDEAGLEKAINDLQDILVTADAWVYNEKQQCKVTGMADITIDVSEVGGF